MRGTNQRILGVQAACLFFLSWAAAAQEPLLDVVRSLEGKENAERVETAKEFLENAGLSPQLQPFEAEAAGQELSGTNVVLRIEGTETALAPLVIGAHIDTSLLRGSDGWSPGASDNASGSTVVMHLAKSLAAAPLRHSVDVLLFDLEEWGFLGSRHYVGTLQSKPAAMVNVDIGTSGRTIAYGPSFAPGNEALYAVAKTVCSEQEECLSFRLYPPSDERSFQAAKIPNISFAVLPRVEAHQLWLRLNGGQESGLEEGFLPAVANRIHTADDTSDHVEEDSLATLLDYLDRYVRLLDTEID